MYTSDKNGNRVQMRDWRGKTKYEYDAFNRLKKVTEPDDKWIGYNYDLNNNRISMTDHFGGNTTYSYYDNGLLHELTDRASGLTHYEYWDNGLLKKMTYPNGAYAEYTYHAQRDWLVSLNHYKAGGTVLIAGFTYEYDPTYWGKNGTRTAMEENILLPGEQSRIESTAEYTYDNVYRLTGEERTGSLSYTKSYTYDDIWNRLTKVEGGVTTYYHYDYQYTGEHGQKLRDYGPWDIPGDLRNTVVNYDSAGNTVSELSAGVLTEYVYNYQNLMTGVKVGGNTTAQFAYDGDGRRASATFTSGTTLFLHDGASRLEELDAVGTMKAVYVSGSFGTVSRHSTSTVYYHADALGSVKSMTTETPVSVTGAYAYDAWGEHVGDYGSTAQPLQFGGCHGYYTHHEEPDLDLLHLGARYYLPHMGRLTQVDPVRGKANPYLYAEADPNRFVDPSGAASKDSTDPWVKKAWECALKCVGECLGNPVQPGDECYDKCLLKCLGKGFSQLGCVEVFCYLFPKNPDCDAGHRNSCHRDQTEITICEDCCDIKYLCCALITRGSAGCQTKRTNCQIDCCLDTIGGEKN